MSRLSGPSIGSSRPVANVYTGLAFVSFVATVVALAVMVWKCMEMGVFS